MANINENIFSTPLTPANTTAINGGITAIKSNLPQGGAFVLTDEQLAARPSMDVDNRVQVQKTIEEVTNFGAAVLPGYFQATDIQRDLDLFMQMEALEGQVDNLKNAIMYIKRQVAYEAVGKAGAAYQMFKAAANAGIAEAQGSYERLRERYENQGGNSQQPQS